MRWRLPMSRRSSRAPLAARTCSAATVSGAPWPSRWPSSWRRGEKPWHGWWPWTRCRHRSPSPRPGTTPPPAPNPMYRALENHGRRVLETVIARARGHHAKLPADVAHRLGGMLTLHIEAAIAYRTRRLRAPVHVLSTGGGRDALIAGWAAIAGGGVSGEEVPGDTFSMLAPPSRRGRRPLHRRRPRGSRTVTTPAGRAAPVAPRNPLEARLARIWEEVLPPSATPIGVDDDFFDLGGESLHAFAVIGRVLREFGVQLSPRDLFACPSVGAMAAVIDDLQRHRDGAAPFRGIECRGTQPPESLLGIVIESAGAAGAGADAHPAAPVTTAASPPRPSAPAARSARSPPASPRCRGFPARRARPSRRRARPPSARTLPR